MKSPKELPALTDLADACNSGACNVYALVQSLAKAAAPLSLGEIHQHPAVKVIIGQISFLLGESLGPTVEALDAYRTWRNPAPKGWDVIEA